MQKKLYGLFTAFICIFLFSVTAYSADQTISCETWYAEELTFCSDITYDNPLMELDMNIVFTNADQSETLVVPCFWDGGNKWKARFALPESGTWTFVTSCTDVTNKGLNGNTGAVFCSPYSGDLDIYRHGFIKTEENLKYFVYDDNTPFFYIGDTHWGMPSEELDSAGEHAGNIQTNSHFQYIVDKRTEQGFTVYQSEPLGAAYNLSDGLSQADISAFQYLDRQFDAIAKAGLVHANAQFFYPSEMKAPIFENKLYLEKLTRYWVARYAAYPVLWTLGQEVDNNFYNVFETETNPYIDVCRYIHKYDPYQHPITAHQENTGSVNASGSAFRNVQGHTWYASQWSPALKKQLDFSVPKDYWYNGGKVAVNYEGRYDFLWTKHFGARVQGWTAYLNGMYGYGYGCIDMWLYKSTYDTDTTSNDGITDITPADKAVLWSESINFETADQMGYMRDFFSRMNWWNLKPDFDNHVYFSPNRFANFINTCKSLFTQDTCFIKKIADFLQIKSFSSYYSAATEENNTYVVYFYNRSLYTGKLKNMDSESAYKIRWYNPRANKYTDICITTPVNGTYVIPQKPDSNDWILIAQKYI